MIVELGEILTDLLAGSTHAIQTSGEIYQSFDLPSAPPCTARSNVAIPWLLGAASLCGTSESGNILGIPFFPQNKLFVCFDFLETGSHLVEPGLEISM